MRASLIKFPRQPSCCLCQICENFYLYSSTTKMSVSIMDSFLQVWICRQVSKVFKKGPKATVFLQFTSCLLIIEKRLQGCQSQSWTCFCRSGFADRHQRCSKKDLRQLFSCDSHFVCWSLRKGCMDVKVNQLDVNYYIRSNTRSYPYNCPSASFSV